MAGPHDSTFPKSVPPIEDDVNRFVFGFHKGSYSTTEQANLIDPVVEGMGHPAEIFAGATRVEIESNPYAEQAEEPETQEEASYEELPSKVDEALGFERDEEDKSGDQSQGSSVEYDAEAAEEGARDANVESSGKSGVSNLQDHTEEDNSSEEDNSEEDKDKSEEAVESAEKAEEAASESREAAEAAAESNDDFESKVDNLKVAQLNELENNNDDLNLGDGNRDSRREALKEAYNNSDDDAKTKLSEDVDSVLGE